jgi:quercetin dioxygenase-like cupin family protein
MRPARLLVPILLLAAHATAVPAHEGTAAPAAPKADVKNLMIQALDPKFTPGREVLVDDVRIPPNTALERHWHPGEEFHVYLEGEVEIQIEGLPSIHGVPGAVGHVPFRKPHRAVAGAQGARILVFRVHTAGEPWRYAAPEGGEKR